MTDRISEETRSKIMSKIRSTNTGPELILKDVLKGTYIRYQPKMKGKPDFASKKHKVAVFIDGCFWHKCPKCYRPPKSNEEYWLPKLENNVKRDIRITHELEEQGWTVLRFWEHEILGDVEKCAKKTKKYFL